MDDRVLVDPKSITQEDLPLVVLSDDLRGFFGWLIKSHVSGNWNHVFIMHKPGMMASQGFSTFKEFSIDAYMNSSQMLKFWRIKDMTLGQKKEIIDAVNARLALPWYKRGYDYLGIFGQMVRLPFIQNPWQWFCSEQVRKDYISEFKQIANCFPPELNPSEFDKIFKAHPEFSECLGYHWQD